MATLVSVYIVMIATFAAGCFQLVKIYSLFLADLSWRFSDAPYRTSDTARLHQLTAIAVATCAVLFVTGAVAMFAGLIPPLDHRSASLPTRTFVLLLCAAGGALELAFYLRLGTWPDRGLWFIDIAPLALALCAGTGGLAREISRRRSLPSPE